MYANWAHNFFDIYRIYRANFAEPCADAIAQAALAKDGVSQSIASILDGMATAKTEDQGFLESLLSFVSGEENGVATTYYWQNDFSGPRRHVNILDRLKQAYPNFKPQFLGTTYFIAEKSKENWSYRITALIETPSQKELVPGRPYTPEDLNKLVSNISTQSRILLQDKRPVANISWPGTPTSLSIQELLQPALAPL